MSQLGPVDHDAILDFALEARSFPDVAAYRTGILPGLRRLVACDVAGYNEVDVASGTTVVVGEPADSFFTGVEDRFASLVHQHPVVSRAQAGDRATYKISDFLSERQFHRLELYQDMYRLVGAEDQIAFALPGDVIIGIALNRGRRSFTERDRAVLERVRPQLAQAYAHTREREVAAALIGALEAGLADSGRSAIVVDRRHGLLHVGPGARDLLAAYLGRPAAGEAKLPEEVEDWLAQCAAGGSAPLTLSGSHGRLVLRLLPRGAGEERAVVVLEEQRIDSPSLESLRRLGLTRREAEVTRLLACGRSNAAIAQELFISVHTVRKHLEHAYARLGVESRAQAIAAVLARDC